MFTKETLNYHDTQFDIDTYWLDKINDFDQEIDHPVAIIMPGGAFKFQTDREAQPIAMKFAAAGFHALVLHYQVLKDGKSVYPLALQELSTTLNWLKSQQKQHEIDLDKVVLVGFSAGGQIVANFNSIMTNPEIREKVFDQTLEVMPCANVMGYSVSDLTLGWPKTIEEVKQMSPDKLFWKAQDTLTKSAKPTFIWQTVTDQTVPVKNSIVYATKLEELGVPFELHLFSSGPHGLSLASYQTQTPGRKDHINPQVSKWWELCLNWFKQQGILPKP